MDQVTTWDLHSVFVQANLINGFRFLDLSGVVLNQMGSIYNEMQVDPSGAMLRGLRNPDDEAHPYALRVGPWQIWLHYAPAISLNQVADTAPPLIKDIARIIEVEQFDRLGVRVVYYVPSKNVAQSAYSLASKILGEPFSHYLTPGLRDEAHFNLELPFVF